jgi:hypothetical protein
LLYIIILKITIIIIMNKMDIRINGKTLLAVGLLSAGLAFGEYVSVISSDSVSYTSAVPETPVIK